MNGPVQLVPERHCVSFHWADEATGWPGQACHRIEACELQVACPSTARSICAYEDALPCPKGIEAGLMATLLGTPETTRLFELETSQIRSV